MGVYTDYEVQTDYDGDYDSASDSADDSIWDRESTAGDEEVPPGWTALVWTLDWI